MTTATKPAKPPRDLDPRNPHHRLAPPTINLDNLDPQVELDIPTTARELRGGDIAALNNSFGFGGANVAVAFGSV